MSNLFYKFQLKKLEEDQRKRADIRCWYINELKGLHSIIVPFADQNETVSNYIFPVVLGRDVQLSRKVVRRQLAEAGIQTSVHYPAVHRFSMFKELQSNVPNTEYASDNLISLPMFANLQKSQVVQVVSKLWEILDISHG